MIESKLTKTGYELESVSIVQSENSPIEHRSECDPMIEMCGRKVYPVIVAPMGAVTDEYNYKTWLDNNFICVVPRTVDFKKRMEISKETFVSVSLAEAEELLDFINKNPLDIVYEKEVGCDYSNADMRDIFAVNCIKQHTNIVYMEKRYICIDIAHGTMSKLYDICDKLKTLYGDKIEIMTGNVANPKAYIYYASNSIDYQRLSIGSGSRCTTRCNVGVGYPSATLIDESRMEKERWEELHPNEKSTKLIMDGGISNFDDIQKCICLGANAVMSGSIFAKAQEACEPIVFLQPDNLNMADAILAEEYANRLADLKERSESCDECDNEYWEAYKRLSKRKPYRLYYGMSTKLAQKKTGGSGKTTSEGISKPIPIEYPIAKWADNMASYMKSCMSYTGCRTIKELIENTELIINGSSEKSFRK